jgi:hypothetical protein
MGRKIWGLDFDYGGRRPWPLFDAHREATLDKTKNLLEKGGRCIAFDILRNSRIHAQANKRLAFLKPGLKAKL